MENSLITKKKRQIDIDIARGIVILFVMLGHLVKFNSYIFDVIFSFHMPFFFLISGYSSNLEMTKEPFGTYLLKNFYSLLIPSLVVRIFTVFYNQETSLAEIFKTVFLLSSTEWFFTALFLSKILFWVYLRIDAQIKGSVLRCIFAGSIVAISPIMVHLFNNKNLHNALLIPFQLDSVMLGFMFIIIGFWIGKRIPALSKKSPIDVKQYNILILFGCVACLILTYVADSYINVFEAQMGLSDTYFIFAATVWFLAILSFAKFMTKQMENWRWLGTINKQLIYFGKHSVFVYPAHAFLYLLISRAIHKFTGISITIMVNMTPIEILIYFISSIFILSVIMKIYDYLKAYFLRKRPEHLAFKEERRASQRYHLNKLLSYDPEKGRQNFYRYAKVLHVLALLVFLWSLCVARLMNGLSSALGFASFLTLLFLGAILSAYSGSNRMKNLSRQMVIVYLPLTFFWNVSVIFYCINHVHLNLIAYWGLICLNGAFVIWLVLALRDSQLSWGRFKVSFIAHWELWMLCAIVLVIVAPRMNEWYRNDSFSYYTDIMSRLYTWDFTLNDLMQLSAGYHVSLGYSILAYPFTYLFKTNGLGLRLVQILIFLGTFFVLNDLLKQLFTKLSRTTRFLITTLFAFSPLMLGTIAELGMDFVQACFFLWMIWAHVKNKLILRSVFIGMVCFSKENGILFALCFLGGIVLHRLFLSIKSKGFMHKQHRIYSLLDWSTLFFPACFAMNFFGTSSGWKEELSLATKAGQLNSIVFDLHYCFVKIKQALFLNFGWLILIPIIVFAIRMILDRRHEKLKLTETSTGLIFSYIGFWAFSFLYHIFVLYRYQALNQVLVLFGLAFMIENISPHERTRNIPLLLVTLLMLIQSFTNLDPLSYIAFFNVDVGQKNIVSTTDYLSSKYNARILQSTKDGGDYKNTPFRDFIQYNYDYTSFEHCFERGLAAIGFQSGDTIVIPPIYIDVVDPSNSFSYYYTQINLFGMEVAKNHLYWHSDSKQVDYDTRGELIKFCDLRQLPKDYTNYDSVWLLRPPYETEWDYNKGLERYKTIKTVSVEYNGWTLDFQLIKLVRDTKDAMNLGAGTKTDPYLIGNVADLLALANNVNSGNEFKDQYFLQSTNIDLSGITWNPIAMIQSKFAFRGYYDGGGHTISNLNCDSLFDQGLFGSLAGTVANLGIESSTIQGNTCGSICVRSVDENATIMNCYSNANIVAYRSGGGIAADFDGLILNCWFGGQVSGINTGAICASGSGTLMYCYALDNLVTSNFSGRSLKCKVLVPREISTLYLRLNEGLELSSETLPTARSAHWQKTSENDVKLVPRVEFYYKISDIFNGDGTSSSPFLIETAKQLQAFRNLVNAGHPIRDCYFRQIDDIDLKGEVWIPIGKFSRENCFRGVYDGSGHTVKNLLITSDRHAGFFGVLDGTVMNFGIESGQIKGINCGSIANMSASSNARIINCYNLATIVANNRAGGIADNFAEGNIVNCWSDCSLSGKVTYGIVSKSANSIINCYSIKNTSFAQDIMGTVDEVSGKTWAIKSEVFAGLMTCKANILKASEYIIGWQMCSSDVISYKADQIALVSFVEYPDYTMLAILIMFYLCVIFLAILHQIHARKYSQNHLE